MLWLKRKVLEIFKLKKKWNDKKKLFKTMKYVDLFIFINKLFLVVAKFYLLIFFFFSDNI